MRQTVNCYAHGVLGVLLLSVAMLYAPAVSAKNWLNSINGSWQVTQVHINVESSRTTFYDWNDPRLVGRLFTFGPGKISDDSPEAVVCNNPSTQEITMNPADAIKRSMGGYGYPSRQPDAKAYGIDLSSSGGATVVQIYCDNRIWHSDLGGDRGVRGAWAVPLSRGRLLLRWYDETLLVLTRVPPRAKPNPSFPCSGHGNGAETAICQSYELSAFDRSVANAYERLLSQARQTGGDVNNIISDQQAWLRKRNACGQNQLCIIELMKARLEWLVSGGKS